MRSVKGIILRARPYQENDLIVEVIGSLGERQSLLAKNALKSRKRFSGGVLEPLNFAELFFSSRKSGIDLLHEGSVLYGFPRLRENYEKIKMALYFVRVILDFSREGLDENKLLFDLLGNSLKALEGSEDLLILKVHFEIKFLYYLGFYSPAGELFEFARRPVSEHQEIKVPATKLQEILRHTHQQIEQLKHL